MQQVGLAADLAIFNIGLPAARRVIHNRFVPFAAAGALESRLHSLIILRLDSSVASNPSKHYLMLHGGSQFMSYAQIGCSCHRLNL